MLYIAPCIKSGPSTRDLSNRLSNLLSQVETYTYTSESLKGGCIFIPDDATSLKRCLDNLEITGSSNDFTHKLWDILKECETAEDLIALLIKALKSVSTGKMKPFITPSNKSYLGRLVLKLSRGHPQTSGVLNSLHSSPRRALSLLAQLAIEMISQQLVHLLTLVDHSMCAANILNSQKRSNETIDQINQTLHDMTMGCDLTMNPFENKSLTENSIRLTQESFIEDDPAELTVDNFASLKRHGLVMEKKCEAPLVLDEIDMSGWKAVLGRFAQMFVCLEHLNRAQQSLRLDFGSLSSILNGLQDYYLADKSPVQTISQLCNEPVQNYSSPINPALLREHLNNKRASFYRVHISRKSERESGVRERQSESASTTHVFSQRSVFPPSMYKVNEAEPEAGDVTLSTGLKYHHYKYLHVTTHIMTNFKLLKTL